jgi:acetylornithine deacetylase/succinyl-diaminopimelate desuccinylase-like protein
MATLNALQSIQEVTGDLPFNLIFGVEGEEEQASVHLPEWAEKRERELKQCEAMAMPMPSQTFPGAPPSLILGLKGIVYMELELNTNPIDVHSSVANILPNPVWRLVWALNSMRGQDEVLIEGFYDNVEPPSPEDLELVDKYSELLVKAMTATYQVKNFRGENLKAMARNLIFQPSPINVDGIFSGWTGPGTKTITPAKATVKIDVRLVPNMTTEEVINRIKNHLKKRGFEDIEVRVLGAYEWVKASIKENISQAAIKTFKDLGYDPVVLPMMPGSAPFYLFCREPFNMKVVMGGLGHGGRVHAPNEYLMVNGIKDLEKYVVSFLYNYAET